MADYLSPNNTGLTIVEKQDMFSVLNRMVKISYNFPRNQNIENCCGQVRNMEHIYNCKFLNTEEAKLPYRYLFSGNLGQQVSVYKRFRNNFEESEKLKIETQKDDNCSQAIPHWDPLYLPLYSNGFE